MYERYYVMKLYVKFIRITRLITLLEMNIEVGRLEMVSVEIVVNRVCTLITKSWLFDLRKK